MMGRKPFIATHPDRVCPTNLPTVLVDCGSVCAALECATGRKPLSIPGKPNRMMLDGLLERHAVGASPLAMVGDRLYTDMAMARASGALGVLVLTGETTADQAADSPLPDVVVKDLHELAPNGIAAILCSLCRFALTRRASEEMACIPRWRVLKLRS